MLGGRERKNHRHCQEPGHGGCQGLCSWTRALVIIKTEKEASTYRDDQEQDDKRVLGCKKLRSKVLPNSKPGKRLKITLSRKLQSRAEGPHV